MVSALINDAPVLHAYSIIYCYRSGKLVALDNRFKSLETSMAYVSTLGGGYFLCRYVTEARACARAQLACEYPDRVSLHSHTVITCESDH